MTLQQHSKIWCQLIHLEHQINVRLTVISQLRGPLLVWKLHRKGFLAELLFPTTSSVFPLALVLNWMSDLYPKEAPHILPMQLDKSLDGHHAVPWQRVLALSILELMTHLDNRLTVQMQALSRKHRLSLGSTFHIVIRLEVTSMNVNATE